MNWVDETEVCPDCDGWCTEGEMDMFGKCQTCWGDE